MTYSKGGGVGGRNFQTGKVGRRRNLDSKEEKKIPGRHQTAIEEEGQQDEQNKRKIKKP